ncbi:hypothetical protein LJC34_07200 [Oscillospiraceae bacterium OttesenSCG-928-G22]|nr:hypothetical protein [Oscillospiraceae bacterium OttesenSCG-928-G22]
MQKCPYCGAELENETGAVCPACSRPLAGVTSGSSLQTARENGAGWPHSDDGTPEEAKILMTVEDGFGGEVPLSLLRAFAIPFVLQYPLFGRLTRVYAGMSMAGVDVYVPESLVETAVELLTNPPELTEEMTSGTPEE